MISFSTYVLAFQKCPVFKNANTKCSKFSKMSSIWQNVHSPQLSAHSVKIHTFQNVPYFQLFLIHSTCFHFTQISSPSGPKLNLVLTKIEVQSHTPRVTGPTHRAMCGHGRTNRLKKASYHHGNVHAVYQSEVN